MQKIKLNVYTTKIYLTISNVLLTMKLHNVYIQMIKSLKLVENDSTKRAVLIR